jgi:hypothetical protein
MALTDHPQPQVLMESFPMETNVHESGISMRVARAFGAFWIALLITHYDNLPKVVPTDLGRQRQAVFLYPNSYADDSGIRTMFKYLERPDPSKLIFIATVGHSKVFDKFTQRYSKAPTLCRCWGGPWAVQSYSTTYRMVYGSQGVPGAYHIPCPGC